MPYRGRPFAAQVALNAATAVDLKAAVTGETIYVTKLTLSIVTHAAKFVEFKDTAASPVIFAKHLDVTPQAAGVPATVTWDFGTRGFKLTADKGLQAVTEAAGVAGYVYAEGYTI